MSMVVAVLVEVVGRGGSTKSDGLLYEWMQHI